MTIVKCENCGTDFDKKPSLIKKSKNHFCSRDCQHKWRTGKTNTINHPKGINKNCEVCEKEFYVYPSEVETKRFCSANCRAKGVGTEKRKRVKRVCNNCQATFETWPSKPSKFCSADCMGQFYSKNGTKIYECDNCGGNFKRNPSNVRTTLKFCSMKCRDNYEFHPHELTWNRIRKMVLERDRRTCQDCGSSYDVMHVHHKIPKRFYLEIMKAHDMENLITLCEPCHIKQESHSWITVPQELRHLVE